MIIIESPKDCCGCNACAQCCPKQCITLQEDNEGFRYPKIDISQCINCNLCETVCPVINQGKEELPLHIYAAKNSNEEIRLQSSSGGIFTLLAEKIIEEGGVVFGARFDEQWEVKHDYTETIEGLSAFRGSKYLQSRIENTYQEVKYFLKQERKVMFSGTPCQVAGLRQYLRRDYPNLLLIDFICHGVPSPKVWRMYLNEMCLKLSNKKANLIISEITNQILPSIKSIKFRDKSSGWKNYSFSLSMNGEGLTINELVSDNLFMKAFLSDIILRPSCYQCPAKKGKSKSDITIADFWGIQHILPAFDDDKGTSLVLVNTQQGASRYNSLSIESVKSEYKSIIRFNGGFKETIEIPKQRDSFFRVLNNNKNITNLLEKNTKPTIKSRLKKQIKKILRKIKRYI